MKLDTLYPSKFLSGRHLPSTGVLVRIESVALETLRVAANAPEQKKPVMVVSLIAPVTTLPGVERRPSGYPVVMSETLARAIAHVLDSDDTDVWSGRQVVIYPTTMKVAGRDVLTIAARERRPGYARCGD